MKVLGVIAEYNPFHNGHSYHLKTSLAICDASHTVAVMSGNFVQRGEPALINKWARTSEALSCGIDLVLELPVVYAMSSAPNFASAAVRILNSLGVVDYISFGSETGDIRKLEHISEILTEEPEPFQSLLKEYLFDGMSYAAAREKAVSAFLYRSGISRDILPPDILASSNNILGIEYLKALKSIGSKIVPLTVRRTGNAYGERNLTGIISSATSIRKAASAESPDENVHETMPASCYKIMQDEFNEGRGPVLPEDFSGMILSKLRSSSPDYLSKSVYLGEGLENRLIEAASNSGTLAEFYKNAGTKRYAPTRISRIVFNMLAGITTADFMSFNDFGGPQYIRILGFNERGREILKKADKLSELPIISKFSDAFELTGSNIPSDHDKRACFKKMLGLESLTTDIYVLAYKNSKHRKGGQEFTSEIVCV